MAALQTSCYVVYDNDSGLPPKYSPLWSDPELIVPSNERPPIVRPNHPGTFEDVCEDGLVPFLVSCDTLNPLYILDGETTTKLWLSLLHEKLSARAYVTDHRLVKMLNYAEMENELSPSTPLPHETAQNFTTVAGYWAAKKQIMNRPHLNISSEAAWVDFSLYGRPKIHLVGDASYPSAREALNGFRDDDRNRR